MAAIFSSVCVQFFAVVMLQQSGSGSVDWVSLAAKMFMSKVHNQAVTQKQRGGKQISPSPSPSPLRARSPAFRPRTSAPHSPAPSHLPPECVATIKQFEALRIQLLRQLVLYQTQLLALKMPPIPCQPSESRRKTIPTKGKITQNGSSTVKKQTSFKKVKSEHCNEAKKWEKIQFPAHTLKNPNKRRSQVFQKPKKSLKKASKRKLEKVQTSVSNNYFENNLNNKSKRPCQPYQSYMRDYSSSTDSVYSTKHLKCNNDCCLEDSSGKDTSNQNSSFKSVSSINEGKNNTLMSRLPKRKASKLNKKMSSVFDTATDEAQSSL